MIRDAFRAAGGCYDEGTFSVEILALFPVPKSWTRAERDKMRANNYLHTNKPDLDNIVKTVLDALNGVAYHDDGCVAEIKAHKRYVKWETETPGMRVKLTKMEASL